VPIDPYMVAALARKPLAQPAEYIIRGQYGSPAGPRPLVLPQGEDLNAALQAIDRLRLFPNPPSLDPNTLKLQGRL